MTYQEFMQLDEEAKKVIIASILDLTNAIQAHLAEQPTNPKEIE